ncbi:MAG: hypothetical protein AB1649_26620 [Chloroflexota bacterium]
MTSGLEVNQKVGDLLGYPLDEIVGRPLFDFIAPTEKTILRAKQEWERTFDTMPDLVLILDWYLHRFSQRAGIEVSMESTGLEERLPEQVEITLYRVIQEALTTDFLVITHIAKIGESIRCNSCEADTSLTRLSREAIMPNI